MSEKTYVPIPKRSREEILEAINDSTPQVVAGALMSAAYWDDDWKWAQDLLLRFSHNPDPDIKWAVARGFGLIAAFHGQLDLQRVEPVLQEMGGADAEDALADLDHFVRRRQAGEDIDLAERLPD